MGKKNNEATGFIERRHAMRHEELSVGELYVNSIMGPALNGLYGGGLWPVAETYHVDRNVLSSGNGKSYPD